MSARILVVDDVPLNVELLRVKLASEYYEVLTAGDGPQALKICAAERPDVVLLDVMMPGMDGFEVCRKLKADPVTADIPVVMVTALTEAKDRVAGLEAGADDFLSKPINNTALFARVKSLVRVKRMMDEWRLRDDISARLAAIMENGRRPTDRRGAKILLLEDGDHAARRLAEMLAPIASSVVRAKTAAEAVALVDPEIELVIAGEAEGDVLRVVATFVSGDATRHLPVLLVVDAEAMDVVAKGFELGASDYVLRPFDRAELVARARGQIKRKRLHEALRNDVRSGMKLALTDALTGLYNRRYAEAHIGGLLTRIPEAGGKIPTLVLLDIDHFKRINDTWGHPAGDAVLKQIADRLKRRIRTSDLAARMGGEEFMVVLPETDPDGAGVAAERLRAMIAEAPYALPDGTSIEVTASFGIASALPAGDSLESWMKRADEALYAAKRGGRNRVASAEGTDGGAAGAA